MLDPDPAIRIRQLEYLWYDVLLGMAKNPKLDENVREDAGMKVVDRCIENRMMSFLSLMVNDCQLPMKVREAALAGVKQMNPASTLAIHRSGMLSRGTVKPPHPKPPDQIGPQRRQSVRNV